MPLAPDIRRSLTRLGDTAANVPFANPITAVRIDELLDALSPAPDDTVLDVGARRCELLIRLVERYGCHAIGVDNVEGFAAIAMERARGRIPLDRLSVHEQTAAEFFAQHPSDVYAITMCVGSSHAFGDYGDMIRGSMRRTRAHGLLFVGYPFSNAQSDSAGHAAHISFAAQLGLEVVMEWAASDEDWQEFHRTMLAGYQEYAAQHPHDPDSRRFLDPRVQLPIARFLESIRRTTGFGYGLFRVPAGS